MGRAKPAKYNQPNQSTETSFETKILFKKQQDSLRHFYKKLRILKFSDLLCPQNLVLDEKQKSSKIWRQTTTTIKLNPEQKDFSI